MREDFVLLAGGTSFDVVGRPFLQPRPPIMGGHSLDRLVAPWMASRWLSSP